ncbi:hypothetical protein BESB_040450 [Besnoitia besnoiti]|uniref:PH domain-containing protein n=1 Tax=Besnoitia besnoiti TaxID=94643 RepID=A0A2A9MNS4_BESBE|nr:hypothetical protein BESB_040450 [Besnoitia besnoiti]PFH37587.1 hypothetical protein BESB_040450 [Besnoitia besnoiti]
MQGSAFSPPLDEAALAAGDVFVQSASLVRASDSTAPGAADLPADSHEGAWTRARGGCGPPEAVDVVALWEAAGEEETETSLLTADLEIETGGTAASALVGASAIPSRASASRIPVDERRGTSGGECGVAPGVHTPGVDSPSAGQAPGDRFSARAEGREAAGRASPSAQAAFAAFDVPAGGEEEEGEKILRELRRGGTEEGDFGGAAGSRQDGAARAKGEARGAAFAEEFEKRDHAGGENDAFAFDVDWICASSAMSMQAPHAGADWGDGGPSSGDKNAPWWQAEEDGWQSFQSAAPAVEPSPFVGPRQALFESVFPDSLSSSDPLRDARVNSLESGKLSRRLSSSARSAGEREADSPFAFSLPTDSALSQRALTLATASSSPPQPVPAPAPPGWRVLAGRRQRPRLMWILALADWEGDREARSTTVGRLTAVLAAVLAATVEQSVAVTRKTTKYLRARAKAEGDFAKLLRQCVASGRIKHEQNPFSLLQAKTAVDPFDAQREKKPAEAGAFQSEKTTRELRKRAEDAAPESGACSDPTARSGDAAGRGPTAREGIRESAFGGEGDATSRRRRSLSSCANAEETRQRSTFFSSCAVDALKKESHSGVGTPPDGERRTSDGAECRKRSSVSSEGGRKRTGALFFFPDFSSSLRERMRRKGDETGRTSSRVSVEGEPGDGEVDERDRQRLATRQPTLSTEKKDDALTGERGRQSEDAHSASFGSTYEDMPIDSFAESSSFNDTDGKEEISFSTQHAYATPSSDPRSISSSSSSLPPSSLTSGPFTACSDTSTASTGCPLSGAWKSAETGVSSDPDRARPVSAPGTGVLAGGSETPPGGASGDDAKGGKRPGHRGPAGGVSWQKANKWGSAASFLSQLTPQFGRPSLGSTGHESGSGRSGSTAAKKTSSSGDGLSVGDRKKSASATSLGGCAGGAGEDSQRGGAEGDAGAEAETGLSRREIEKGKGSDEDKKGESEKKRQLVVCGQTQQAVQDTLFPSMSSSSWLLGLLEMNQQTALQSELLGSFVDAELVQNFLQKLCTEYQRTAAKHLDTVKKYRLQALKADEACRQAWITYEQACEESSRDTLHALNTGEGQAGGAQGTGPAGGATGGAGATRKSPQCTWLLERKFAAAAQKAQQEELIHVRALLCCLFELQCLEKWRCDTLRHVLQSFLLKLQSCLSVVLLTLDRVSDILESPSSAFSTSRRDSLLFSPSSPDFGLVSSAEVVRRLPPAGAGGFAPFSSGVAARPALSSSPASAVSQIADRLRQSQQENAYLLREKRRELWCTKDFPAYVSAQGPALDGSLASRGLESTSPPSSPSFGAGGGVERLERRRRSEKSAKRSRARTRQSASYSKPTHSDLVDTAQFADVPDGASTEEEAERARSGRREEGPDDFGDAAPSGTLLSRRSAARGRRRRADEASGSDGEGRADDGRQGADDRGHRLSEHEALGGSPRAGRDAYAPEREEPVSRQAQTAESLGASRAFSAAGEERAAAPGVERDKDRRRRPTEEEHEDVNAVRSLLKSCGLFDAVSAEGRAFVDALTLPACVKCPLIAQLAKQLQYGPLPASHLVFKEALVERQAGAGGAGSAFSGFSHKWRAGYLLLTWDRFLHMFKQSDDALEARSACWSICLAKAEVRKCKMRDQKVATIEIRERRKRFFSARSSCVFRPPTARECDEWMSALKTIGDDKLFFEAAAKRATNLRPSRLALATPTRRRGSSSRSPRLWGDGGICLISSLAAACPVDTLSPESSATIDETSMGEASRCSSPTWALPPAFHDKTLASFPLFPVAQEGQERERERGCAGQEEAFDRHSAFSASMSPFEFRRRQSHSLSSACSPTSPASVRGARVRGCELLDGRLLRESLGREHGAGENGSVHQASQKNGEIHLFAEDSGRSPHTASHRMRLDGERDG